MLFLPTLPCRTRENSGGCSKDSCETSSVCRKLHLLTLFDVLPLPVSGIHTVHTTTGAHRDQLVPHILYVNATPPYITVDLTILLATARNQWVNFSQVARMDLPYTGLSFFSSLKPRLGQRLHFPCLPCGVEQNRV